MVSKCISINLCKRLEVQDLTAFICIEAMRSILVFFQYRLYRHQESLNETTSIVFTNHFMESIFNILWISQHACYRLVYNMFSMYIYACSIVMQTSIECCICSNKRLKSLFLTTHNFKSCVTLHATEAELKHPQLIEST